MSYSNFKFVQINMKQLLYLLIRNKFGTHWIQIKGHVHELFECLSAKTHDTFLLRTKNACLIGNTYNDNLGAWDGVVYLFMSIIRTYNSSK